MEYIIYCDESVKQGKYFQNFYGGALVSSKDLMLVNASLCEKKKELNILGEVKWNKVSTNYLEKYMQLMDVFFAFVKDNIVKVRIMFTHNYTPPKNLTREQIENGYFLLYYQFIKHAFGLQYCNSTGQPVRLRIYFDKLPDTREKNERFKDYIYGLQHLKPFQKAHIVIDRQDITEVISHNHVILQCTDVILGAMQFRLNDMHKEKPPGQFRRGKKTIAKEKLYKHINRLIRDIHPNFNTGVSTGIADLADKWNQPYRHWNFIPREYYIDQSKVKNK